MNIKVLISMALLSLLCGCGSPYKERGYKSEADYDFAMSANLSPIGVERFKNVGVSNAEQYRSTLLMMQSSGYSSSNDVDEVLQYARDRFEGAKVGQTALDRKKERLAEAARLKQEKEEAAQREAKRRAEEEAARKRQQEIAEEQRRQKRAQEEAEARRILLANKEYLRRANIYETDVLSLIVNFQTYKGKKVFMKCWINLFSPYGGNCRSRDDSQTVSIENEGIDKDFYKWLLINCQNRLYSQNNYSCRDIGVIGTVSGVSVPRLINVRHFKLD